MKELVDNEGMRYFSKHCLYEDKLIDEDKIMFLRSIIPNFDNLNRHSQAYLWLNVESNS